MGKKTIPTVDEDRLDSVSGGLQTPDGSCRESGPNSGKCSGVQLNPEIEDAESTDGPESQF